MKCTGLSLTKDWMHMSSIEATSKSFRDSLTSNSMQLNSMQLTCKNAISLDGEGDYEEACSGIDRSDFPLAVEWKQKRQKKTNQSVPRRARSGVPQMKSTQQYHENINRC